MLLLKLLVGLCTVLLLHGLFRWVLAKILNIEIEKKQLFLTHKLAPNFEQQSLGKRLVYIFSSISFPFIVAFIAMALYFYSNGKGKPLAKSATNGIHCSKIAKTMGFEHGDQIVKLGEEAFEYFEPNKVRSAFVFNEGQEVTINRGGAEQVLTLPNGFPVEELANNKARLFYARVPFVVGGFANNSPAKVAGLEVGDRLTKINGQELTFFDEYVETISENPSQELALSFIRAGKEQVLKVPVSENGKIGVFPIPARLEQEELGFGDAIAKCIPGSWRYFMSLFPDFGQSNPSESLGGFVSIGQLQSSFVADIYLIMVGLAYLLGFINLIPLRGLDGGLFLANK